MVRVFIIGYCGNLLDEATNIFSEGPAQRFERAMAYLRLYTSGAER